MAYFQFNSTDALPIRAQVFGSTYHYPNKTPSEIYTLYNSVPTRKNDSYNTIVMTKHQDGEYYAGIYAIHLPTDRIIDIDTTHDNSYLGFTWTNIATTGQVNDAWGSNCLYSHSAKINSDDTNFNLNGNVYNQYGGSGHYTVDNVIYYYSSWWRYSENTPLQIYTTVPLYNIRVNGEPVVPIITETLKTPRNTSLIEINTVIRDIKTALLHKYGRDDIEDPVVNSIEISNYVDATIYYKIDTQIMYPYEYCKLVIKKNAIPVNKEDGDKILDVSPYNIKIKVTDLDDSSRYFVKIFVEDTNGTIAMSAGKVFKTGTIYNFDYTGQIQTFVVPETGIYSLETWGAQGGNAEDGNNSARGGYGSYSYGEIALQKGETLYINVGGQNGYGGGGEKIGIIPAELSYITKVNNFNQANISYDPILIASFFEHIADGNYFHEATYTRDINSVSVTGPQFTYNSTSKYHDDSFEATTSHSNYAYYTAYNAPFDIRVTGDSNGATVEYSNPTALYVNEFLSDFWAAGGMTTHTRNFQLASVYRDTNNHDLFMIKVTSEGNPNVYKQTSFNSLSDAIAYIYNHYCNINLWVNNERWVFARNSN